MTERTPTSDHRIVLLTHDTPYGRHMAHRFVQSGALKAVLVFRRPPAPRPSLLFRLKRRARSLLQNTAKPRSELDTTEARLQADAQAYFDVAAGDDPGWPSVIEVKTVTDANSADTVGWLKDQSPDLLVVAGGPILRAPILSVARLGAINLHSSLLPAYRGTFVEFWQVHDDALDTAGVTVHRIDVGVDTGDILAQYPTSPEPKEDPWRLRARNQLAALDVLPETAMRLLAGNVTERPQPADGRAFRMKDITEDARRTVLRKVRAL